MPGPYQLIQKKPEYISLYAFKWRNHFSLTIFSCEYLADTVFASSVFFFHCLLKACKIILIPPNFNFLLLSLTVISVEYLWIILSCDSHCPVRRTTLIFYVNACWLLITVASTFKFFYNKIAIIIIFSWLIT